jgi:hypothetical protein
LEQQSEDFSSWCLLEQQSEDFSSWCLLEQQPDICTSQYVFSGS